MGFRIHLGVSVNSRYSLRSEVLIIHQDLDSGLQGLLRDCTADNENVVVRVRMSLSRLYDNGA